MPQSQGLVAGEERARTAEMVAGTNDLIGIQKVSVIGGGGGGTLDLTDLLAYTGPTTATKVDTDAAGSMNAKLRGIVSRLVELLAKFPAVLGAGGGIKVDGSGTALPVSGPLTDTQLRATAVPVSGTVTASGPLTDTQLRATPVPVSGTVTATGGLTDTQLRATAVPVSSAASSQADGHSATLGLSTTDAAATNVVEDTTAKTGIGLFKGIKNLLKLINDKLVTGTDIGDVTVNNASGAAAVNVQDGGNTLTVDGAVTVSGTATVTQGTAGASAWPVSVAAVASGGSTPFSTLDLDETGQLVKGSAGQIYGYYIFNNAAAVRYVKFYDHVDAPVAGDTPTFTLGIPAGAAANLDSTKGIAFAAGIGLRATTGVAAADTGAPGANELVVNLWYK